MELSATVNSNAGVFGIAAPPIAPSKVDFRSRGSALQIAGTEILQAGPSTFVLGGIGNISGASVILRLNGAAVANTTTGQGTGNYGNYPLFLFRRGGTSLPFNGRFYGLVIVGRRLTGGELMRLEKYTNSKTGAF
jgi:hypothetical protein